MTTYNEMMPERVMQEELAKEREVESAPSLGEVLIDYTNHRGERRNRVIVPSSLLWFPNGNEWHPGPQWILWAMDREDGDQLKAFAMSRIHSWRKVDG